MVTVPNFLVVGGARCGTTALIEGLRRHPKVFITEPKEPHFFALHRLGANFTAPGDEHTINRVAVLDRDDYLALYDGAERRTDPYLAVGEGSVSTMYYYEQSLPELLAMNSAMKLIVLLREPVERAYSAYGYMRARGLEPEEDFLTAVRLEDERRAAGWHHIWHYTAMSLYADSVSAMQQAVNPDQLRIFFYDDMADDYERVVGEVFDYLDVPQLPNAQTVPRVNISGQPRSAILHRGISWATAQPMIRSSVKSLTSYRLREAVRRRVVTRDGVPEEARATLAPLFSEDLTRLRQLLPGPVPSWLER